MDTQNQEIVKPLTLAPGIFFTVEFSAKGGVAYRRVGSEEKTIHADESMEAEYTTRKEVDHIGLQTWSRKIVNMAYNVMDKYCSATPIGYWIAEDQAPKLIEELNQVKQEAGKLNHFARTVRSARRVLIEVYAIRVGEESLESVAVRLAQTVRERLGNLLEDLQNGDLNAYQTSWKRAKNLPRLATGIQAEAIVLGLEAAKEARSKLYEALKGKTEEAQKKAEGAKLDLVALESAIVLFTDSVNGTLANVEDEAIAA